MIESAPVATAQPTVYGTEQLLPITASPQTVYVSIVTSGTTLKAGFSLSPTGTVYTDGMTWVCSPEYALFLNFVFQPSTSGTILSIDPDPTTPGLWVAGPITTSPPCGINQQSCAQNVVGTYKFGVDIQTPSGRTRVDPKIVVTPQHI